MPSRREQHNPFTIRNLNLVWGILCILAGVTLHSLQNAFTSGVWFQKNIPDRTTMENGLNDVKKYVDTKNDEQKKYVDEKVGSAVKSLQDYSDSNRMKMEQSFTTQLSEIKASMSAMAAKQDIIMDQVKNMQGGQRPEAKGRWN